MMKINGEPGQRVIQLRRRRLSAGISVAALAREVGKSRVWLAQREGGHRKLGDKDFSALVAAIGNVMTRRGQLARIEGEI